MYLVKCLKLDKLSETTATSFMAVNHDHYRGLSLLGLAGYGNNFLISFMVNLSSVLSSSEWR